ncbi:MAG TPA: sortase [Propionibacteriaceae bacterium]|nr:sortase [Propionibacteriaceae bacterium]
MDSPVLALLAASVSFVVYLGYVLFAGTSAFWAVVWPDGQDVRRLRMMAVVGLALIGLATIAEALIGWLVPARVLGETADESGTWLLVRLAVLAGAGFFGAELLRRPVRGARRITALTLVVILTITLVVESTAMASPRVVALTATTGVYLLALAAWLGGLMAFAALLVPRNPPGALERVSPRFSRFAGLSVLALTVAGTAQHLIAGGTATTRSGVLLLVEVLALAATLLLCRYAVAYGRRLAFRERYMRGFPVEPRGKRPMLGRAIGVQVVLSVALLGVAVAQLAVLPVPDGPVAVPLGDPSPTTPVATAREARPAAGDTRFVPERIDLPGGVYTAVVPVATVGNELVVPEDPTKVGWWDGSSYVGDPYGSTVIAGHVDVFDRGIGFFFRLWNIKVGERVVLSAGDVRQAYKITTVRQVPRTDLVDDAQVFDIGGPPRLVLITCAGEFRPERGGYSRNLIVVARPVS